MLTLLSWLSAPVHAQTFIIEVGPLNDLEVAGTWARALPTANGWKLAYATADYFFLDDLVEGDTPGTWSLSRAQPMTLNDRQGCKDHAIARCPDGTYLHIASANVTQFNDSAYAWRYDADFSLLASSVIEEGVTERMHNDQVMICADGAQGVAFPSAELGPDAGNLFFPLSDTLEVGETFLIAPIPRAEGGAFLADADGEHIHQIGGDALNKDFLAVTYDESWSVVAEQPFSLIEPPLRAFWAQGLLQLGDYFLVAYVARDDQRFPGGDEGDIYLAVLDRDWSLLERHALTAFDSHSEAAMRPWLAREGRRLLISFDAENHHAVVEATIDPAAFGLTDADLQGDSGAPATEDSAAALPTTDTTSCQGCSSASPGRGAVSVAAAAVFLLAGLGGVRRRSYAPQR